MERKTLWLRLPVTLRTILLGLLLLATATLPSQLLLIANRSYAPAIPWAALVIAPYLALYWSYLGGAGPPASNSAQRKTWLRADWPGVRSWAWAVLLGISASGALFFALFGIVARFIPLPADSGSELFAQTPGIVLISWFAATAVVAGVAEEGVFRGFMQSRIEQRHGIGPAVVIVGILFALAHGLGSPILLGYYFVVSLTYSAMTHFSRSVLPAVFTHSAWDFSLFVWTWKVGFPAPPRPVSEVGYDVSFWVNVAICASLLVVALWALLALARTRRSVEAAQQASSLQ